MSEEHPARLAGQLSQKYVAGGERDKWLDLFADDAIVQDPVGVSPFDPTGKGQIGKAAIAAFYDAFIAKVKVSFHYPRSYAAGNECAFVGTVFTQVGDQEMASEGVFIYKVNDDGKLASLRAMWEHERPKWVGPEHPPVGRS